MLKAQTDMRYICLEFTGIYTVTVLHSNSSRLLILAYMYNVYVINTHVCPSTCVGGMMIAYTSVPTARRGHRRSLCPFRSVVSMVDQDPETRNKENTHNFSDRSPNLIAVNYIQMTCNREMIFLFLPDLSNFVFGTIKCLHFSML